MTGLSVLYAKEAAGEREWVATPDRDRTGRLREVTRRTDTEIVGRDARFTTWFELNPGTSCARNEVEELFREGLGIRENSPLTADYLIQAMTVV